ncbi:amine oxidase [Marivirga lumbricoides]|uniref:Amine oxidase n=1 Tax=Marivirga lumbricoides TaxID=1046115 RepID=A0A2T4DR32_9BACT|nr:amine oxidase [Marivirga lumbricoides]
MQEEKIIVIGAGLAGLVAAVELEKAGFNPVIIEADDRIGGRVKTDKVNGFLLDHGFQVLLTAYPEAAKYLDYEKLDLQYFNPGALVLNREDAYRISDPLRQPSRIIEMMFSQVGSFSDKLKIFKWTRALKATTVEQIFKKKETTALQFLKKKGFTNVMIQQFFQPFFGGIFLENELNTSSRMLEFVFKMFGEGYAALPAKGMGAIPEMLAAQLSTTEIMLNQKVEKIGLKSVELENGKRIAADAVIIATNPEKLVPQLKDQFEDWQSVLNLYFESDITPIDEALIGLVPDEGMLINNFCVMNKTAENYAPAGKYLLSISVNDTQGKDDAAVQQEVIRELKELVPELAQAEIRHLKSYLINKALPKIDDYQYSMKPSNSKIQEGLYLAGDYLLNGSINAAMLSGRLAAYAVYEDIKGRGFKS